MASLNFDSEPTTVPVVTKTPLSATPPPPSPASVGPSAAAAPPPALKRGRWPPELFDLLALTSALFATLGIAPLLAFQRGDVAEADAVFLSLAAAGSSPTSVSGGLAITTAVVSSLTALSLICAILVRVALCFETELDKASRLLLHRLLVPLIVLATVPLCAGIIVSPVSLYWSGWVVFPPSVTDTPRWLWAGIWFMVLIFLVLVYAVAVTLYMRKHRKAV